MFIFLGAPYIEYLWGNRSLSTTLSAITAAVVGVILNLAVWFAAYTAFDKVNTFTGFGMEFIVPVWDSVDWFAVLIGTGAFLALFRYKIDMLKVLAASVGIDRKSVVWGKGGSVSVELGCRRIIQK